jgi:hypothetical protein
MNADSDAQASGRNLRARANQPIRDEIVDFCFSLTCVRLMINGVCRPSLVRGRAAARLGTFYSRLPAVGRRHVVNPVRGRE